VVRAKRITTPPIPREVKEHCEKNWVDDAEGSLICQRTLVGALSFLNLVMTFPISFSTPDPSRPEKLDRGSYPLRQCRLDTFVAGAACRAAGIRAKECDLSYLLISLADF
jgi:hypothetical protein